MMRPAATVKPSSRPPERVEVGFTGLWKCGRARGLRMVVVHIVDVRGGATQSTGTNIDVDGTGGEE